MQGIKHIIFDLGGVILNIDYQLTYKAFGELGVKDFTSLYSQFQGSRLFDDLETGRVAPDVFLEAMHEHVPAAVTDEQIIAAWNAMLLDFPLQRLQLLQQLQLHYNTYLLSNTNAIHLDKFNAILQESRGIPSLAAFFNKVYYSHLIGYRKPEKEAYQLILDENGLDAAETLFIDDTLPNIEGAKAVGLQTIHLQAPKTISEIFKAATSR
ncbi:HAD family phosphatase [Chitinophaga agrisoli]|uniref:HAD family phosphatase n=1 Tax=Chitinophaga agrisoli TaxID=2607653 RepID=A0A5B2W2E8_9BACT|nr:HAD family phosphatase [Chitinophaga agrisoli]KAA2244920.1 HAD family phosphatase [Chitinophaga agrisoli]